MEEQSNSTGVGPFMGFVANKKNRITPFVLSLNPPEWFPISVFLLRGNCLYVSVQPNEWDHVCDTNYITLIQTNWDHLRQFKDPNSIKFMASYTMNRTILDNKL